MFERRVYARLLQHDIGTSIRRLALLLPEERTSALAGLSGGLYMVGGSDMQTAIA